MKLYEVEIIVRAVVVAENMQDAYRVAESEKHDIVRNDDLECDVVGEVKRESQLPGAWDAGCIPFGSEDDATIGDYLDNAPPERDTKTIDMFASIQTGAATQDTKGGEA